MVQSRKIVKSQNLVASVEETRLTELEAKMEALLRGDTSDLPRELAGLMRNVPIDPHVDAELLREKPCILNDMHTATR